MKTYSNMKKYIFCFILFLIVVFPIKAQKNKYSKDKVIENKVVDITTPADSIVCLLSLNKQLFLSTITTIQLIDKNDILSIKMYSPNDEEYKLAVENIKIIAIKNKRVVGFFVIELRKDVKLPKIFAAMT